MPNTACTRRWGFAPFSNIVLCFGIFLAGRLCRPRPSAGNANRWAALLKLCEKIPKIAIPVKSHILISIILANFQYL